jgi:integrin alpha FG-GAP repeat containing protein 1|tara:strand:+ start:692 stop:1312 length:621 start_codon:yes stop_codon:yes gene_type:complete
MIENSMLDLLVVSNYPGGYGEYAEDTPGEGWTFKIPQISAIYNNLNGDTFYIKTRMLTDEIIGSPVKAASFRCVLTSLLDDKFVVQGGFTGQSTYGALQVPNVMIGVGRSNNFIEMFTVADYIQGTRSSREWSPIIPKSVLYVYSEMEKDPMWWELSLLVNPTSKINLILVVDAMLLLIIGLVIIVLYFQEKVEDEKEQVDAFNYF